MLAEFSANIILENVGWPWKISSFFDIVIWIEFSVLFCFGIWLVGAGLVFTVFGIREIMRYYLEFWS